MLRRTQLPTSHSCQNTLGRVRFCARPNKVPQLIAASLLAWSVTATSFGHSTPIRNFSPQQATDPADTQQQIFFPRATNRAIPGDSEVDQLLIKFLDLHTAMKYENAADVARQIVQLRPRHKDSHYNLACSLARLDRIKDALEELELAINYGWRDTTHLALDNDLDSIRHSRKYMVLLKKIARLRQLEGFVPSKLRNESWSYIAEELSRDIPALMKRYHVPGTSVALVRNGQVVWNTGFGVQDLSTSIPVAANTIFPAPGTDRLFAAIATMQLHEQGSLQYTTSSETNQHFLPISLSSNSYDQTSEQTNIRNGWQVGRLTLFATGQDISISKESGWVSAKPAASTKQYSTQSSRTKPVGYFAAIAAIESISNKPFAEYCHDQLLTPIEANDTWMSFPDAADITRVATGYSRLTTPVAQSPKDDSAFNIHCTSADMARLMTQLMFEPPGQSTTLLDNVTIMQLAQVARDFGFDASVDHAANALRMQLHRVSNGTGVLMRWYPSQRSGIVILYNSETGSEAAIRIAHQALGGS